MRPFASLGRVPAGVSSMRRTLVLVSVFVLVAGSAAPTRPYAQPVPAGAAHVPRHRPRLGTRRRPESVRRLRLRPEGRLLRGHRAALLPRDGARSRTGLARTSASDDRHRQARHRFDGRLQGARRERGRAHRHRGEVHADARAQARGGRADNGERTARPAAVPAGSRRAWSQAPAIAGRSRSTSPPESCARSTWSGWSSTSTGWSRRRCRSGGFPRRSKHKPWSLARMRLATRRTGAFDLYPDTRSQVYLGIDTRAVDQCRRQCDSRPGRALRGTGRQRRTSSRHPVGARCRPKTPLGRTRPYLVSVPDPYDSISPHHDWGPLVFTGAKLAKVLKDEGPRSSIYSRS